MPTRSWPIGIALLGNVIVASATYALRGWNVAGAHAAARNTARFSVLWFMAGLAAPGLARLLMSLADEVRLIQAFLAAHLVHFATVTALIVTFEGRHLREHPGQAATVIIMGSGLTLLAGLTATPRSSKPYTIIHRIALYSVFLLFFLAFVHNPVKPLRLIALALGLAFLVRISSRFLYGRERVPQAA